MKNNIQIQKSSKIFVAGGTGLVGSAIIKNLLEKGYTNIISNYRSRIPNNSTFNIQHSTLRNEVRNTHINIGTGIDVSIRDLAYMIKDLISYKGELYFNTEKPDGTMVKLTDVTKLNTLGWKHTVELKQGIEKMYSWYLDNVK